MEKIDIGLVYQSKTTKQSILNTITTLEDKLKNNKIKKKKKNIIKKIKKNLENSIISPEQQIQYNKYIDSIFNKFNSDIIKTYNSPFNPQLKNIIYHEINDKDTLRKIIIKGYCKNQYFGKLINLKDIMLDVYINDIKIQYYKL
jgi:hypothetical protein